MKNRYTPVIEVKEVHKSFKTVHAVQGLSLTIGKGQFVALLGPNGAGKTTLVEMIEGIRHPDKGANTEIGNGLINMVVMPMMLYRVSFSVTTIFPAGVSR